MTTAPPAAPPRVGDLMEPTVVLDPDTPCSALEQGWHTGWTASSVLVRARHPDTRHGLVSRESFVAATAAGPGPGHGTWSRLPVGRLTRWDAPCVDVDDSVTVAARVLTSAGAYYADLLVTQGGHPVGVLAPRVVMAALAALVEPRTTPSTPSTPSILDRGAARTSVGSGTRGEVLRPRHPYLLPTATLAVVYQPIVAAGSGRLESVEALLRTRQADDELGAPGPALAEAAEAGAALELDLWVLGEACRAWARWHAVLGPRAPRTVHVNLAPTSLAAPDLESRVLAVLDAVRAPASAVRLELSECASLDDLHRAGPALHGLRAAGVQIALDDLGATLSTLRHMSRLPLDVLKIDRSIVIGMAEDVVDAHIVQAVLRVARERGLEVVAEGVEEQSQLDAVRRSGVGYVQGYLLARPMSADAITRFVG
ncbi:EAL domain-containing protein [Cellulomonas soli]|uniref:EAL domain-containing protein n=1 Tax=Cellulomonas soli TaxID=931535 RepID=UPI0011BFBCF3|nr:EAL domain-containing protein [Cellulomonas soli]NYI61030.1 EAL domain-containing protein (putative c-di-GMP-specific phosphodiesterase class I) [Cellulomonas soli]